MPRSVVALILLTLPLQARGADSPVQIIAHRGASYDAPENTVAAIKLAWEQKADGAEFDVYLSKDGKIVAMHDKDVKRTGGLAKKVAELTFEELRRLDVGKWKHPKYAGEKVPTLAEMLATIPPGRVVFIEVKCGPEIVPVLDRELKAAKLPPSQTPVICFNADVIATMKKVRPDVPCYWLVSLNKRNGKAPTAQELIAKAKQIKADGLDLSASDLLDAKFASAVKAACLSLYVWTVNDPKVAKRMVEIGVHGITTDRPAWLREQLAK